MGSWIGIKVRHADGREGRVASDNDVYGHRELTLVVNGGPNAQILLNAWGKDSGEAGWSWLCEGFDGGPKWLPLGDHNSKSEH